MRTNLKTLIIEKYRNQSKFAICCGKPEQWISRIINCRQEPTVEDIDIFKRKLGAEDIELLLKKFDY